MVPIIFFLDNRPKFKQNVINKLLYGEDSYNDIKIGDVRTEIFSDGEISIDYETSIRGKVVYIVSTPNSSEKIMTLNLAIDAAKRAGAKEIIPIITYFPYGRSDKKDQTRGSIGGKVIAEMIARR